MSTTDRFVDDKYLARRYSVRRATIWDWVRTRNFPRPIKFSPQCSRWRMSAVLDWEESREVA